MSREPPHGPGGVAAGRVDASGHADVGSLRPLLRAGGTGAARPNDCRQARTSPRLSGPTAATDTAGGGTVVMVETSGVKVLIAGSGQHPDDFSRTIPGELVFPGQVCGRDDLERGGDGSCGCGRAFVGAASHSPTTVAIVVDRREVDLDQLAVLLHDSATVAGWTVDTDWAAGFASDLAEEAASWPVGTRLRRTLDDELVPE